MYACNGLLYAHVLVHVCMFVNVCLNALIGRPRKGVNCKELYKIVSLKCIARVNQKVLTRQETVHYKQLQRRTVKRNKENQR